MTSVFRAVSLVILESAQPTVDGQCEVGGSTFTHPEIEQQLGKTKPIDAVTLYRVLDWLTENGLVDRAVGDDQVWRFSTGSGYASHDHAHFRCTKCIMLVCMSKVKLPRKISLPAGFHSQEIELLIKGICPQCN